MDSDKNGLIDRREFVDGLAEYVRRRGSGAVDASHAVNVDVPAAGGGGGDDDDHEEIPADLKNLSVDDQQRAIGRRAASLLIGGTLTVLAFSDPMVDVLSEVGVRTHIPAFYVAFVLAPMASNASEVVASGAYAAKKTSSTVSIAFVALLGAATMNNTFCLGIFLALVAVRDLEWTFGSETLAILLAELALFSMVALKRRFTCLDGLLVLAVYPVSLGLVIVLQTVVGMS